jgi:hypothetical protein
MRKMSEESEFDDEDGDDDNRLGRKFGGFTSTVCVNFSQDDLRLATIPGHEGVRRRHHFILPSTQLTFSYRILILPPDASPKKN